MTNEPKIRFYLDISISTHFSLLGAKIICRGIFGDKAVSRHEHVYHHELVSVY